MTFYLHFTNFVYNRISLSYFYYGLTVFIKKEKKTEGIRNIVKIWLFLFCL